MSATIRLESRPPLSIAPSGTSLMRRMRTDSSSFVEHDLGPFAPTSAASRSGAGAG